MPCPTADLKLALSSFLRVQFHGCHFALGVGAFLTPQCGFYKFHQPAPAPAAAVFKQQQNNKTPVVEEPAYYMLLLVKEWHLPPLLPAKDGPPQQAGGNRHAAIWLDGSYSTAHIRPPPSTMSIQWPIEAFSNMHEIGKHQHPNEHI